MVEEKGGMEGSKVFADPQQGVHSTVSGRQKGFQENFVDTTNLVRSIQRAEGNPDCFRKGNADCDRLDCFWRRYCLQEQGAGQEEEM